jgi:DeoR/GlpR family transcriptional regulator of sugar metabolism
MLKEERFQLIKNKLITAPSVLLAELCAEMNVSDDTIRRDLLELEKAGVLIKVHGGAMAPPPATEAVVTPLLELNEEPIQNAAKVLDLFEDGNTLLLNGGPSTVEMAKEISRTIRLTVFTNSFLVVAALADKPLIQVVMLGGNVMHTSQTTAGAEVFRQLKSLSCDWLVTGTSFLDPERGITTASREDAQLLREMMSRCSQKLILAEPKAWGLSERHQVCSLHEIQVLSVPDPLVASVKDQLKSFSLEIR